MAENKQETTSPPHDLPPYWRKAVREASSSIGKAVGPSPLLIETFGEMTAEEASAARRILNTPPRKSEQSWLQRLNPNWRSERGSASRGTLLLGAGALTGALLLSSTIGNAVNQDNRTEQIKADHAIEQNYELALETLALENANPSEIIDTITIGEEDSTLYDQAMAIAESTTAYQEDPSTNADAIHTTSIAAGSYENGDEFVVTVHAIDGKPTTIVQLPAED